MPYQYRMVQIPPNIEVSGSGRGNEAAQYLQDLADREAQEGWDFFRVDAIGVVESPGCLGALLGRKAEYTQYYVVTFRKEN